MKRTPNLTVGSLAVGLHRNHGWDPDAAYAAAYAYIHNAPTPHTKWQALAIMDRSQPCSIDQSLEDAILQAYRKVRFG